VNACSRIGAATNPRVAADLAWLRARLAAATIALTTTLSAQTIAGTWQGTLPIAATAQGAPPGTGNPRIVFTIEKNPDGSFHGGMTFLDRGTSVPLTSVIFSAPDVTFAQSATGLTYRGKLSADGKSIAGTWKQGDQSLPLTMQLATADTLWKREGPAALPPMAANADPSFEVATIKPAKPEEAHALFDLHARQFNATGMTATELIEIAYNVPVAARSSAARPGSTRRATTSSPNPARPACPASSRTASWSTNCSPSASTSSPTPTGSSTPSWPSPSIPKPRVPRPATPTSIATAACSAGAMATTSSFSSPEPPSRSSSPSS
jgi:hypothetical protein